jgi:hypothetical protein
MRSVCGVRKSERDVEVLDARRSAVGTRPHICLVVLTWTTPTAHNLQLLLSTEAYFRKYQRGGTVEIE